MDKQKNDSDSDEPFNVPDQQRVTIQLTLRIDTGNIIYGEFTNWEDAIAFARHYATNPKAILDKISPKPPSP